jgi:hypothetical protein
MCRGPLAVDHPRPTTADPSEVSTRDDFATFIEGVFSDYPVERTVRNGRTRVSMASSTLSRGAAGARVVGRRDQETPSWRTFAALIVAATA